MITAPCMLYTCSRKIISLCDAGQSEQLLITAGDDKPEGGVPVHGHQEGSEQGAVRAEAAAHCPVRGHGQEDGHHHGQGVSPASRLYVSVCTSLHLEPTPCKHKIVQRQQPAA